jgi:hypothetical protein
MEVVVLAGTVPQLALHNLEEQHQEAVCATHLVTKAAAVLIAMDMQPQEVKVALD